MTQQEYENELKELRERLEKLEATKVEEPQSKRWKPKYEEVYWLVRFDGDVSSYYWTNIPYNKYHYLTGNCFKTKEEAEEYKKQIEYTARYKNYIEEHSDSSCNKFGKNRQAKYYAVFKYNVNKIDVLYSVGNWKTQGIIYASSERIIWDAIKGIGEDNFKKYVLGVK